MAVGKWVVTQKRKQSPGSLAVGLAICLGGGYLDIVSLASYGQQHSLQQGGSLLIVVRLDIDQLRH